MPESMQEDVMGRCVLALDFDGVLHPADDAVLANFSAPPWQLAVQMRAQGRFVWLPQLEEAMYGSAARVLVHSTWRRRLSDRALQEILGPEVGSRMIVADAWIDPRQRQDLTHAAYIHEALTAWQEVEGVTVQSLCVLDDRPELFLADADLLKTWPVMHIWTDGAKGISDEGVQRLLRGWVMAHGACAMPEESDAAPPCPSPR